MRGAEEEDLTGRSTTVGCRVRDFFMGADQYQWVLIQHRAALGCVIHVQETKSMGGLRRISFLLSFGHRNTIYSELPGKRLLSDIRSQEDTQE